MQSANKRQLPKDECRVRDTARLRERESERVSEIWPSIPAVLRLLLLHATWKLSASSFWPSMPLSEAAVKRGLCRKLPYLDMQKVLSAKSIVIIFAD